MTFELDPFEKEVAEFYKHNTPLDKFMRGLGLVDYAYSQKKAWAAVMKKPVAWLALAKLPSSKHDGIYASDLKKDMANYDKSNLSKYLNILIDFGFVESEEANEGRPKYKRTKIGDYFIDHAGYIFSPRGAMQDAILKTEEKNLKLKQANEILTAENLNLKEKLKILQEGGQ